MNLVRKITQAKNPDFHIRSNRSLLKWTAIFMAFAVLNLTSGCRNYFKITSSGTPDSESVSSFADAKKTILVHFNEKKWVLSNVEIKNNVVSGKLDEYKMPPTLNPVKADKPNRYLTRASQNQRYLLNEVHIYVDEFTKTENNQVTIPVSSINKVEIYDRDTAATVGSYFLGAIGYSASAFALFIILVAIFKESCPFIYTWDGNNFQFSGEIYSGSIHKPLERNDYLKLPTYAKQSSYSMKITNEVREIQHTNLLELLVVDHPENTIVLTDKSGAIHSLSQLQAPQRASAVSGENVTSQIAEKDDIFYQSTFAENEIPQKDGLILEFPSQGKAKTAKLAIHAKNSILLDYMIGQFHDQFGNAYKGYMKKQQNAPEAQMRQWTLDQGIPLSLYVERNNKWEFVDYYHIAGPMKFKDDVLQFPLNGNETNPLKLKLEFGSFLWEIDYTAIDYSPDQKLTSYTIPAKTALDENKKSVAGLISNDDQKYYSQPTTDNYAEITFDLPDLTEQSRTIVLHSKGWYQVLQDPKGKPDIEYLKAFRNPGHFNQFVSEQLKEMEKQISQP
jgi:hypothetical protein